MSTSAVVQKEYRWIRFDAPRPINRKLLAGLALPPGWTLRRNRHPVVVWVQCDDMNFFHHMTAEWRDNFATQLLLIPKRGT